LARKTKPRGKYDLGALVRTFQKKSGRQLLFYLNGERIVLDNPDPTMLLVDYLRSPSVGYTGTKIGCKEGGCGACTVMLSHYDRSAKRVVHRAVNSCLRPVCSLAGMAVTTTEGIGSVRHQLDPVQDRIAAENGSQCGFCTPGFVMSMYTLLCNAPAPTEQQVEDAFDGHICRCTGYRPILRGMRTFAADHCRQQGTTPVFLHSGHGRVRRKLAPRVASSTSLKTFRPPHGCNGSEIQAKAQRLFPPELSQGHYRPRGLYFAKGKHQWFKVLELTDVYALKKNVPGEMKLVVGNTSVGIYKKNVDDPTVFVDISTIKELNHIGIASGGTGVQIGGAVTLSRLMEFLDDTISKRGDRGTGGLIALRLHLQRVANVQVRNVASLAGNLMLTKIHERRGTPFPSDLFTVLAALGASVTIGSSFWRQGRRFSMLEFAAASDLPADYVVLSVVIPFSRRNEFVRSYKVARRLQNAHAIVNAGLRVRMTESGMVATDGATIVIGGIAAVPIRAARTEALLERKPWRDATLQEALRILGAEIRERIIDFPGAVSASYRTSLAQAFLYKFFVYVAMQVNPSEVARAYRSAAEELERPLSSGEEHFQVYLDEAPVSEPIIKLTAFSQASGEAIYTHDVPLPPRTLHGALVLSTRTKAAFRYDLAGGLDKVIETVKRKYPGVKDFLTVRDITSPGTNLIGIGGDDTVFADRKVTCAGSPIGLVVAETEDVATAAATFVQTKCIRYVEERPVLTIEEALALPNEEGLFKDNPKTALFLSHVPQVERPGSNREWLNDPARPERGCRVVRGRQRTGDQAQFYMETQAVLAVPGEGNAITLYASTQDPDTVQHSVAAVLGISVNEVSISVNLVGGGFGGKTTRVPFVAAPAALAAFKHHRPVRLVLDRNSDTKMIGKRHPFLGEYHAMFTPGGTMNGLKVALWADGGNSYDCSFFVMDEAQLNGDGAYMIPTYRTDGNVCRTNKPSNNAMRSFGVIQSSLVCEEAIEHVAHELGMLPEEVRRKNLYKTATRNSWDTTPYGEPLKYCDIRRVWDILLHTSDFATRERWIREFNQANRWRKRGISMIPLKYGVSYARRMLNQARALVNTYSGDGSVLLLHGGVEIGQGIHTKMAQIAAGALGIPMSKIKVSETNTRVIGNATSTGASTGSDLNGAAVSKACKLLRARLESLCQNLRKSKGEQFCVDQGIAYWREKDGWKAMVKTKGSKTPSLMWSNVVNLAWMNRIDLTGEAFYRTPHLVDVDAEHPHGHPYFYYTYCAAVSEVEIDVLTGEFSILRADLLYDAGKSLNPALDIGQVQGAFVQGIGNLTTEQLLYAEDGQLISDGTWEYKPPCSKTIPVDFRVTLLKADKLAQHPEKLIDPGAIESRKPKGTVIAPAAIQSSRSTGEPPLVLANTVFFAIKHAILAARQDQGHNEWFELEAPATVERIQSACHLRPEQLVLQHPQ